jgi:hypothetical protein
MKRERETPPPLFAKRERGLGKRKAIDARRTTTVSTY